MLKNLDSVSIIDIVQRTGTKLKKEGSLYVALCPLHNDKGTQSFTIYPRSNSWCCFGKCGIKLGYNGGDGIEFIKQLYGYSYPEAVRWIEENFSFNIKSAVEIVDEPKPKPKIVPPDFVLYWYSMLGEHRSYFHSRGFEDEIIDRELWGWDGDKYTIPVWEGEPGNSACLGVRRRKSDFSDEHTPKYTGLPGMNPPTIWGRWYCQNFKTILIFAGELDAARAVQDGFGAASVVNGINALKEFPPEWPALWFPGSFRLIACFDKKEEVMGGQLCHQWNRVKGTLMGRVFHWCEGEYKDYCKFRETKGVEDFKELLLKQLLTYN